MKLIAVLLLLFIHSKGEEVHSPYCDFCRCSVNRNELTVDCGNNPQYIPERIFEEKLYMNNEEPYDIHTLSLRDNAIMELNGTFPNSTLKVLDLSETSLISISDSCFKNLQSIEELILSNNDLDILTEHTFMGIRLDGQDYPLRSLKILRLDNNNIHTLGSDTFRHIQRDLTHLYLNDNKIVNIDLLTQQAITSIAYLEHLDLSRTHITKLPENFLHTPGYLKVLELADNKITNIESLGLWEAHALEVLNLDGNPIENISNQTCFPGISTLHTLHMSRMPLLQFIGNHSFANLENLKELHLSSNPNLTRIDKYAVTKFDEVGNSQILNLEKLYINNNQLTHLDLQIEYGNLKDVDIRGNPWTCECENQWMLDSLIPLYYKINKEEAEELTCAAPIEMLGRKMYNLSESKYQMRCLDKYGNQPERDGTVLVCLLIGLLLGIVVVLGIMYSYQRRWFGFGDKSPAAYSRQFYGRTQSADEDDIY